MKVSNLVCAGLLLVGCGSVNEEKKDGGIENDGPPMEDAMVVDTPPVACTATTCANDTLEVCGSTGTVERTEHCGLGCFTDGMRCNVIDPSNGLAASVDQAAQQGDITLPDGATINTDTGVISSLQGTIAVATTTVVQPGGAMLRTFVAKSFTLGNVKVTGRLPLALVAHGVITVGGIVDISADAGTLGPGSAACSTGDGGAPSGGHWERSRASASPGTPDYVWINNGGGGGGFGTAGGAGGLGTDVGAAGVGGPANGNASLVPLRGGCRGFSDIDSTRGGGGGAIQLVSNEEVRFIAASGGRGIIDAGGGGGHAGYLGNDGGTGGLTQIATAGGGSGGGILIEAPVVTLADTTGLLAAGGGGGGFGPCTTPSGADANVSNMVAAGGACPVGISPTVSGGDGAVTAAGATGGAATGAGGGGGGLGRIRINTADGQYAATGAIVRGAVSTGTVGSR